MANFSKSAFTWGESYYGSPLQQLSGRGHLSEARRIIWGEFRYGDSNKDYEPVYIKLHELFIDTSTLVSEAARPSDLKQLRTDRRAEFIVYEDHPRLGRWRFGSRNIMPIRLWRSEGRSAAVERSKALARGLNSVSAVLRAAPSASAALISQLAKMSGAVQWPGGFPADKPVRVRRTVRTSVSVQPPETIIGGGITARATATAEPSEGNGHGTNCATSAALISWPGGGLAPRRWSGPWEGRWRPPVYMKITHIGE
ncbi:hypothetical protein C4J81_16420 [Deltaproteobacteria bacterium Smac51]|nr:hypothetical protein C4J81_16420 [Deltaproteobacteria bacterium Smac51]